MTRLLTVAEAAEALALRPNTIRAWIFDQRIDVVHVGRAVRIPADAIERLIAANTVPAREEENGRS